jgi:hypothetical protein
MGMLNLDRIRRAWRDAGDGDVARALLAAEDYPREVYALIEAEARVRHIQLDDAGAFERSQPYVVKRVVWPLIRLARVYPFVGALLLGLALRLSLILIPLWLSSWHWAVWIALYAGVCLSFLTIICWPLRAYRIVLLAALGFCIGDGLVNLVELLVYYDPRRVYPWYLMAGNFLAWQVILWGVLAGLLSVAVWARNRYWPLHVPGHCVNCGYNLRGLPEPRCPECGQPFEPGAAEETQDGPPTPSPCDRETR